MQDASSTHTHVMLPRLPMRFRAHIFSGTALTFAALTLSFGSPSALTLREKWRAEELKFRTSLGSICDGCDAGAIGPRRAPKRYSALIDPIAVLESSSRTTARYLAAASPATRVLPTPIVDRTLASINRHVSRKDARVHARRRLAKLIRARRYAALISRRKAQAQANSAAARYKVELGRVEQQPQ